jgi:hypothetical protein
VHPDFGVKSGVGKGPTICDGRGVLGTSLIEEGLGIGVGDAIGEIVCDGRGVLETGLVDEGL